jgi:hypothetical protein
MITQEQIDNINDELDHVMDMQFSSVAGAWETISIILEGYGISVPVISSFDDEMLFKLEEEQEIPHMLYMLVIDEENDHNICAALVTQEELNEIACAEDDETEDV